MKKITSLLIIVLGMSIPFFPVEAADLNKALNSLPADEEWSIMAYAAAGQVVGKSYLQSPLNSNSATDYEKRILAIAAIGENPATFGQENFVSELKSFYDGQQIGSPTLLNDDIFGLQALIAAGESGSIVTSLRSYILSKQNVDGGWGFIVSGVSDSNMTAMAILALSATGSVPPNGVNYLLNCQNSDGGFGFSPRSASDGASTAWAISAGHGGITAINFLEVLQLSDGSFKWLPSDSSGSVLVTAYAVKALHENSPANSFHNTTTTNSDNTSPTSSYPSTNNSPAVTSSGPQTAVPETKTTFPDRLIVSRGTIYKIKNNILYPFTASMIYFSHGYKFSDARPATADELKLPVSCCMDWADGSLVNDTGTVYLVKNGFKYGFTSEQAFLNRGHNFKQVLAGSTWWLKSGDVFK